MNKYNHSKQPTSQKAKTRPDGSARRSLLQLSRDRKKAANHTTVERIYGFFTPKFGGSLGTTYLSGLGLYAKDNRAQSVI